MREIELVVVVEVVAMTNLFVTSKIPGIFISTNNELVIWVICSNNM